jgi:hypothetical protein
MKKHLLLIPVIAALLASGAAAQTAAQQPAAAPSAADTKAAEREAAAAARFDKVLSKLEAAGVVNADTAAYLRQSTAGGTKVRCDTAKVVPVVIALVNRTGAKAGTLDEAIAYIDEKKMVMSAATQKKLLSGPTCSGETARNLISRLSTYLK